LGQGFKVKAWGRVPHVSEARAIREEVLREPNRGRKGEEGRERKEGRGRKGEEGRERKEAPAGG